MLRAMMQLTAAAAVVLAALAPAAAQTAQCPTGWTGVPPHCSPPYAPNCEALVRFCYGCRSAQACRPGTKWAYVPSKNAWSCVGCRKGRVWNDALHLCCRHQR